jgi:hypothetical protein
MHSEPNGGSRRSRCNGYGHPADCSCGWGGVYYASTAPSSTSGGSIPQAGTRAAWEHGEFCRPSTCPKCRAPVFFVRHNGGSVWFDALGQPWPKHPCMATAPDMQWVNSGIPGGIEPGNRLVFGVIQEARVIEPGDIAFFRIACSEGTIVEDEFVYSLNPCEAVGGLVKLELTPENTIEARRFKALDEARAVHEANLKAEARQRKKRDRIVHAPDGFPMGSISFLWKRRAGTIRMSIGALEADLRRAGVTFVGGIYDLVDFSPEYLALVETKLRIVVSPASGGGKGFSVTIPAKVWSAWLAGKWPTDESWGGLVERLRGWRNGSRPSPE